MRIVSKLFKKSVEHHKINHLETFEQFINRFILLKKFWYSKEILDSKSLDFQNSKVLLASKFHYFIIYKNLDENEFSFLVQFLKYKQNSDFEIDEVLPCIPENWFHSFPYQPELLVWVNEQEFIFASFMKSKKDDIHNVFIFQIDPIQKTLSVLNSYHLDYSKIEYRDSFLIIKTFKFQKVILPKFLIHENSKWLEFDNEAQIFLSRLKTHLIIASDKKINQTIFTKYKIHENGFQFESKNEIISIQIFDRLLRDFSFVVYFDGLEIKILDIQENQSQKLFNVNIYTDGYMKIFGDYDDYHEMFGILNIMGTEINLFKTSPVISPTWKRNYPQKRETLQIKNHIIENDSNRLKFYSHPLTGRVFS